MFKSKLSLMSGDQFRDTYCLEFDGTDEYLDLGDYSDWDFSNGSETVFTFSFWAKANASPGNLDLFVIISNYDNDDDDKKQYFFSFTEDSGNDKVYTRIRKAVGTSDQAASHISQMGLLGRRSDREVTKWNHYCIVYDGSLSSGTETKVYINGIDGSGNAGYGNPTIIPQSGESKLTVGARQDSGEASGYAYYGNISISDLAIYNIALTSAQCATLWNSYDAFDHLGGPYKKNLKAFYRFGDTQFGGNTTRKSKFDSIGDGSKGLIVNQVTYQTSRSSWDSGPDGNGSVANWTVYGTNAVAQRAWSSASTNHPSGITITGEVRITYADNAAGAYIRLNDTEDLASDLTVGSVYQLKIAARSNTGTFDIVVNDGDNDQTIATVTSGSSETVYEYTGYFKANHATNCIIKLSNLSSGQQAYLTKFELFEVKGNGHGLTGNMEPSSIVRHKRYRS